MLGAVRTEARPVERDAFDSRPSVGTVQITARAAEGVPKFGEPDIIRIVQLLPGVEARNDFSTGLNVRGGESDQNLILIDGYPIYNPFHLGGLFSTFIDPTVRDVHADDRRISGALRRPAVERARRPFGRGSRAAGVHGTAELSVLASTGELGGAFDDGKATWMIAGRRTYADKFVELISTQRAALSFPRRAGALHVRVHADDQAVGHRVRRARRARREHRAVRRLDRHERERRHVPVRLGATASPARRCRKRRVARPARARALAARRQHDARAARVAVDDSRPCSTSAPDR